MCRACWLVVLCVTMTELALERASASDAKFRVYIGSSTNAKGEGISVCELDVATGRLSEPTLVVETANPSFLALNRKHTHLYAVGEVTTKDGKKAGGVVALVIDRATGRLTKLNDAESQGAGPCHLVVDKTGKNVLVANYGGGSVACLPIAADGSLKPASSSIQHKGKSINPQRQQAPHAHSINLDAGNRFAFAADLGLDEVRIYRFDAETGKLTPNDPPAAKVAAGAGPRHFAFHPSGKFAYVINELGNTVTAFSYDAAAGTLREIQAISTLPADFQGTSYTAEVVAHPSGKFLYGSNRGHDSIAIFEVDMATGRLTAIGHESTQGKTPRNFAIDPTGSILLAENQGSDTIVPFKIDGSTGKLTGTGQTVKVAKPVCVKFVPLP